MESQTIGNNGLKCIKGYDTCFIVHSEYKFSVGFLIWRKDLNWQVTEVDVNFELKYLMT
jgi:hypothetical protein